MTRTLLKATTAWITVLSLLHPIAASADTTTVQPEVTAGPQTAASGFDATIAGVFREPANDPVLSAAQTIDLLRHKVKYVFVLFQENRSFDHYFGTFPGANGLFADPSAVPAARAPATASNTQLIYNTDGSAGTVSAFRIGTQQNASALDDIDHGHLRMAAKMNTPGNTGTPLMDRFALNEQAKRFPGSPINPTAAQIPAVPTLGSKQWGQLAMAYVDCDTIPFLWNYANRFTLFDNVFQTTIGPSTPNAIALIAAQVGETQWVKHPAATSATTYGSIAVPLVNDPLPGLPANSAQYSGLPSQPTNVVASANTGAASGTPQRKNESGSPLNIAPNLTFASLPLSFNGRDTATIAASDANPAADLVDVQNDIPALVARNNSSVAWGWYQNGYDAEPNLPTANAIASTPHASYIGHHNGPQYFGYVVSNPALAAHLHGLNDFFDDIANQALSPAGGVYYIRGGYNNIAGLVPDASHATGYGGVTAAADAAYVTANFNGDDDHPAYADAQISEALVARGVNAIASSSYWSQSAIIITYDESEGDYDHVPPRILSWGPDGVPLDRGPRIPTIVISPFSRAHAISHEEGDHASFIKLINAIFGLAPLADLPDEAAAKIAGQAAQFATAGVTQTELGPHDGVANPTPGTGSLLSAFDPARLMGTAMPLPASYAMIPANTIAAMPHYAGAGCAALGITPIDVQFGISTPPPADFFARPSQTRN